MIKFAQKKYGGFVSILYDFSEPEPESLIKRYLRSKIRRNKLDGLLRNDEIPYLYSYESSGFDILTGLVILNNVITLELSIELLHIPLDLWFCTLRNAKSNYLLWRNLNKKTNLGKSNEIIDELTKEKNNEERRLSAVAHMLKTIANRIKIIDYTLYKTCGYKGNMVRNYVNNYYKVYSLLNIVQIFLYD